MILRLFAFLFLAAFTVAPARAQTPEIASVNVIGTLIEAEGTVTIKIPGQEPAAAKINDPVRQNDLIETAAGSRAFILFMDDTELTLGENTQMTVDDYVFDEENSTLNKGRYSILRGAFLYTSGLLAKSDNPDVQITVPFGAIGIRGTEFWGGDIEGEYGILVNNGSVSVQTERGRIFVEQGQGTSLRSATSIPARASIWPQEQIDRAVQTVGLKQRDAVRQRVTDHAAGQKDLRARHREFLQAHRKDVLDKNMTAPRKRIDNVQRPAEPQGPQPLPTPQVVRPPENPVMPKAPSALDDGPAVPEIDPAQKLKDDLNKPFAPGQPKPPAVPQKTESLLKTTPTNIVEDPAVKPPAAPATPEAPAPGDKGASAKPPAVDLPVMGQNEAHTNELREQQHMQRRQPVMKRSQQQKPAKKPSSAAGAL